MGYIDLKSFLGSEESAKVKRQVQDRTQIYEFFWGKNRWYDEIN